MLHRESVEPFERCIQSNSSRSALHPFRDGDHRPLNDVLADHLSLAGTDLDSKDLAGPVLDEQVNWMRAVVRPPGSKAVD